MRKVIIRIPFFAIFFEIESVRSLFVNSLFLCGLYRFLQKRLNSSEIENILKDFKRSFKHIVKT